MAEAATNISDPAYQLPNSPTKSFRRRGTNGEDLRLGPAARQHFNRVQQCSFTARASPVSLLGN